MILDKELMAINEYEQVSAEAIKNGHLKNSSRWDG